MAVHEKWKVDYVKKQHPVPFSRKFFRCLRPKVNPGEHKMPLNFRSVEKTGSTSNDIESSSPCNCMPREIFNDKVNRDKLYGILKAYLDDECRVQEKEFKNTIVDHTPLHNAVRENNEEMVESLVKKNKTMIDSKARCDLTPLHIAAYKGNIQIAKILLNNGASVDSKCILRDESFVPLDLAIIGGNTNMFKLLLSHGSDKDIMLNYYWKSRLFSQDKKNNVIYIYVLMWHLDNYNKRRKTSLLDSIDSSMLEYESIVNDLYHKKCTYYVCKHRTGNMMILRLLIHKAIESGYTKVVKDLLIWGADIGIIDYTDYGYHISNLTPLHKAVINHRYDIVKILIDNGANVNAQDATGKSSFSYAMQNEDTKIIKLLLKNGTHERNESEILHTAVALIKNISIIEILLQNGLKVNSRNELDRTPLHEAILRERYGRESINENLNIIKLLLRYGADVNAKDYNYQTPLHVASLLGNFKAVEALLEHCIEDKENFFDIDDTNDVGASALILAAETNNENIVKILLNYGANINFKRNDGKTALIRATEKKHEKIVKILLEHCADIEIKNSFGLTAIEVAFERFSLCNAVSYSRIIMLLLNRGADVSSINSIHISTCTSGRMPKCLQKEIIKLKAANIYLDEKKFVDIINNPDLQCYRKNCEKEIEKMKNEKFFNTNIRIYDILTKNLHQLTFICRNRQIVKTLESENYKYAYPNYNQMIENNFQKGLKRKNLIDRALSSFSRLIDYEVFDVLSSDMLTYLRNEDLKNLAEASTL